MSNRLQEDRASTLYKIINKLRLAVINKEVGMLILYLICLKAPYYLKGNYTSVTHSSKEKKKKKKPTTTSPQSHLYTPTQMSILVLRQVWEIYG